jgi:hypothetical protein
MGCLQHLTIINYLKIKSMKALTEEQVKTLISPIAYKFETVQPTFDEKYVYFTLSGELQTKSGAYSNPRVKINLSELQLVVNRYGLKSEALDSEILDLPILV